MLLVQVFEAIKIIPPSLTLTVGAEVQVDVLGGPTPDPGVQFSVGDPLTISVTPNGVVKGVHPGEYSVWVTTMLRIIFILYFLLSEMEPRGGNLMKELEYKPG